MQTKTVQRIPTGYRVDDFVYWTNPDKTPGGLVSLNCKIDSSATIQNNAIAESCEICTKVVVGEHAKVLFNATLQQDVYLEYQAEIGANTLIQHASWIGAHTVICDDVQIGMHCHISDHVVIGNNSSVGHYSSIEANVGIFAGVSIGYNSIIRENCVIDGNVGNMCEIGKNTRIGDGAVISDYSTIGEDVEIGEGVFLPARTVIANGVVLEKENPWSTLLTGDGIITSVYLENNSQWYFWGLEKTKSPVEEFLEFVKNSKFSPVIEKWVRSHLPINK
jgi:UDP-3-O-[3-hydroxymyristoyl] glucosamine N-acyltransferase